MVPITMAFLLFLVAIVANAQPARGYNELGMDYFKSQRYAEALERFELAHKLAPDNPGIRRNLCTTHQALAKVAIDADAIDEALAHLEKAVAIDPTNPGPHVQLGGYMLGLGKLPEAQVHLEAALKRDPTQAEASVLLGEVFYRENKLRQARELWANALKEHPDFPGLEQKLDKVTREEKVESDFESYTSAHFRIRYGKVLSEETRTEVFNILESAYQDIGTALGGIFPVATVEVVLYDGDEFSEATQAERHVGALFDGKLRAPITNAKGRFLSKATLTSRLRHEYVHAVLREKLGFNVPWWFNEGLAETLSREMDRNRLRNLSAAYRGNKTFPFSDLDSNPKKELAPQALALAYAQSHVAVEVLWKENKDKIPDYLDALQHAKTPEEALQQTLGLDYTALDKKTRVASGAEGRQ